MDAELTRLETQLEQLISQYSGLKGENRELRTRVGKLEAENHQLAAKVQLATEKLEALLAKLPEA
ncbi:hypothetical protein CEW87_09310 [Parazoarcus communis]|jgi:uncharacterized protein (TIGR02449 family)|uniref:DUF904 domain-containing protein n=1 Tax=Parazoarcus communis TaxID=41977 RepID=A0A2U8GTM7_9RHOO|nr:cell division protein ZapB [Parazoarcus communis]AWI76818.1 hypothetical protein CEW83_17640 [Parazoarcus communis]AWI79551.1 hypothetical protein CEW87_09310 [Parazoarcus communis]PLX77224.1 MAG: hypothetical protein C0607_01935 [Azoarcus sp.]TVT57737.1 MAG: hypothetical protein FHK80_08310 [Azoarcus sp. PHD]|tara:strand:- start:177011 stop:177205 length:195 start_codon:yes stop_codon:yes gene_type:complete